jgi:ribosomal protein S18 acetylase RimI-like enzyme
MKSILVEDDFDNGRTPRQLQDSFENSFACCIAFNDEQIIGTARALSDEVCNAYIVDVWTYTPYRRQGIARHMMTQIMARLQGQHVYLFTDDALAFYKSLGFKRQGIGLGAVVGDWLVNDP